MTRKIVFMALVFALALSACGAAAPARESQSQPYYDGAGGAATVMAPVEDVSAESAPGQAPVERLVIKNASLQLVVEDPAASVESITALAEGMGGFVVTSNVYQASTDAAGKKIMRATITVRVPAEQLTPALAQLKAMAVTVNSENVSGEDVTSQYTDLESRLRNLEAAEQQLQKIMDGATKTEDVLAVYNQLVSIREQIEQVKGQMKYYRESAALSMISVDLIPDALNRPIEVGGWKPQGVAKDAIEALIDAFQNLATLFIWGGLFCLPLGLVFGIPAFFIGRWAWRRLRKPKSAA